MAAWDARMRGRAGLCAMVVRFGFGVAARPRELVPPSRASSFRSLSLPEPRFLVAKSPSLA